MSIVKSAEKLCQAIQVAPNVSQQQLAQAKGLVYLRVFRAGCIVTVRGGRGLAMLRGKDGTWGAPWALEIGGVALGASIGAERGNFVVLFDSHEETIAFIEGNACVGVNGSIVVGPAGVEGEMISGSSGSGTVMATAQPLGVYGGVSLEFSGVRIDQVANQVQYGRRVELSDMLEARVARPEQLARLFEILERKEGSTPAAGESAPQDSPNKSEAAMPEAEAVPAQDAAALRAAAEAARLEAERLVLAANAAETAEREAPVEALKVA